MELLCLDRQIPARNALPDAVWRGVAGVLCLVVACRLPRSGRCKQRRAAEEEFMGWCVIDRSLSYSLCKILFEPSPIYIYIYIYIYDCWFLFLHLALQDIISFTGDFTVSSRSFTDCGVFALTPFSPLTPFYPWAKREHWSVMVGTWWPHGLTRPFKLGFGPWPRFEER